MLVDAQVLAYEMSDVDIVDDPVLGPVDSLAFARSSPVWPLGQWREVHEVDRIEHGDRAAVAYQFHRYGYGRHQPFRVGIMWDRAHEQSAARIYYDRSSFGIPQRRPPLIGPDRQLAEPAVIQKYHHAIQRGQRNLMETVIRADARFEYQQKTMTGAEAITRFSEPPNGVEAGVPLQYCTLLGEGNTFAAEYISWRRPPHAGLIFYRFDGTGALTLVRSHGGP